MRPVTEKELKEVSGSGTKEIITYGAGALTYAATKNSQASLLAGTLAGEIYEGGYKTAPGVSQGVGSYNPNYNPSLIGSGFGAAGTPGGPGTSGSAFSSAKSGS